MNDELILNNYLLLLKSTVEVYVHGTLESSNEDIRDLLHSGLNETLSSQASTYDTMCEYGWYEVDDVKTSCIKQVIKKINNKDDN